MTHLRKDGFTFKQFFVAHDKCAMKVNTDSILLGGWACIEQVANILDVGSGSGLLSLMLAQRTQPSVCIEGIEIDRAAVMQSKDNIKASPWVERIKIIEGSFIDFAQNASPCFDLVISNPPYFPKGMPCQNKQRDVARYTISLDYYFLLDNAVNLLTINGRVSLVLPLQDYDNIKNYALSHGWYVFRCCHVAHHPQRKAYIVLLELVRYPLEKQVADDRINIYDEYGGKSEKFHLLLSQFYLFF